MRASDHRLRHKARREFADAIRLGLMSRQPCQVCGLPNAEGHHEDYTKPLDVMWLCPTHHYKRHQETRTGLWASIDRAAEWRALAKEAEALHTGSYRVPNITSVASSHGFSLTHVAEALGWSVERLRRALLHGKPRTHARIENAIARMRHEDIYGYSH